MAKGDVRPPARARFDESRDPSDAVETGKSLRVYRCLANGCPMPGAIFLNGHDAPGICSWHYGATGSAFPKITQALRQWECVSAEISAARRAINDPMLATDVKAQSDAIREAWNRMRPAVMGSGWEGALEPGKTEAYGDWCRRLTDFLVARVNAEVTGSSGEMTQTSTVRDMLTRVRSGTIGNAGSHVA